MIKAKVVGKVWATIRAPGLLQKKLLLLAPLDADGNPTGRLLVGADSVSCGRGQTVLLTYGSGARNALGRKSAPVELAVMGILAGSCNKGAGIQAQGAANSRDSGRGGLGIDESEE